MIKSDEIVKIGKFNKPHGVTGEISASFLCEADELHNFSCYIIDINGIFVPFFAETVRPKNDHTVLLKFDGMDSDEAVKIYSNRDTYVLKEEYELLEDEDYDEDEAAAESFIGYTLIDDEVGKIGEIVEVDDSTENALFVIEKEDGDELFVPITIDFITEINNEDQTIHMSLPKGLLEL